MTGEVSYIVVFVTVSNSQEAERIADVLLNERKAACVNVMSSVKSKFLWEGKIDSAEESMLIIKTKLSLFNEVVGRIKEVHSYEAPEIIAVPIIAGSDDYLRWISAEVK